MTSLLQFGRPIILDTEMIAKIKNRYPSEDHRNGRMFKSEQAISLMLD